MVLKNGTRIKMTATVEDLMMVGISKYYSEQIINSEGTIIDHLWGETFLVEIDERRWSIERRFFKLIEGGRQ
ncbi:MAG: hypothetical protein WBV68_08245 [Exiguobacterium oxidotolerans]